MQYFLNFIFTPEKKYETPIMTNKMKPEKRVRKNYFLKWLLLILIMIMMQEENAMIAQETNPAAYEKEIQRWHEQRINSLQREHGWLSLIALDWLNEGENTLEGICTIALQNGKVTASINNNIVATVNEKEFFSGELKTDNDSSGSDKVITGTKAFVIIKRGEQLAVRMWDAEAETRKNFSVIEMFSISPQWKIEARWEEYSPKKKVRIPTIVSGYEDEAEVPGVAVFAIAGKEYRLEPTQDGEEYFFVFADKTNGKETYGAGRFLYTEQAKDGKVILDFNKCYNPPCAFTPFATCPLPTKENRLPVRIEAGEKSYGEQ